MLIYVKLVACRMEQIDSVYVPRNWFDNDGAHSGKSSANGVLRESYSISPIPPSPHFSSHRKMLRGIAVERRFFEWRLFADRRTGGTWPCWVVPARSGSLSRRFELSCNRFPSAGANRDPPMLAIASFFSVFLLVSSRHGQVTASRGGPSPGMGRSGRLGLRLASASACRRRFANTWANNSRYG